LGYMPVNWFAPASAYALVAGRAFADRGIPGSGGRGFIDAALAVLIARRLQSCRPAAGRRGCTFDRLYYFEQGFAKGRLATGAVVGMILRAPRAAMTRPAYHRSLVHLIDCTGSTGFDSILGELTEVLSRVPFA